MAGVRARKAYALPTIETVCVDRHKLDLSWAYSASDCSRKEYSGAPAPEFVLASSTRPLSGACLLFFLFAPVPRKDPQQPAKFKLQFETPDVSKRGVFLPPSLHRKDRKQSSTSRFPRSISKSFSSVSWLLSPLRCLHSDDDDDHGNNTGSDFLAGVFFLLLLQHLQLLFLVGLRRSSRQLLPFRRWPGLGLAGLGLARLGLAQLGLASVFITAT